MISCIISTYKRPVNILMRAVMSVINQTYKDIELIVVNDCPEEKELEKEIRQELLKIENFKINYIVHKKNLGACQARNTGINISKGEFLAFLDDDDEWLENKLEVQLAYFSNPKVGLVYCDNYIISKNSKVLHKNTPSKKFNSITKELLLSNFIGGTSFPLLRKEAVISVGGFDINLKSSQDVDMWIRISQSYECIYCEKPLLNYYISDVSISKNLDKKISGYKYLIDKYKSYYLEDKTLYNLKLLAISGILFVEKYNLEAMEFYKNAIKIKPISIKNISIPFKYIFIKLRKNLKGY